MKIRYEKLCTILSILSVCAFLLSLIPILYVSFYDHPLYDDYGFSSGVHNAILNGGNIFDVLSSSISQVTDTYFNWQGTFSAIFIFSLQPAVFSENLYFLTTFIMIFSLSFSTFFFIETIIVRWFKSKKSYAVIISSLTLICSIQFVIDKKEAFYWFNGSSYYTLFYSFALIFFSLIIRMYLAKTSKRRIILCVIASLLAIIIGGGNYTTALITVIILSLILFFLFKSKTIHKYLYIIIMTLLLISFIISIIAPGNSVRATQTESMPAIKSIIMSLYYAFIYIGEWSKLPQICLFIFVAPILFHISKNTKFNFRFPIIAILISFLCFSAQLTPPLYAISSVGSGRQIDIYYYSYYLLILFDIFYFCGWLNHRKIININFSKNTISKNIIPVTVVLLLLFAAGCFEYGIKNLTSVDTTLSVLNGSVYEYDNEYNTAVEQITSGNGTVEDINTVPDFFGNLEINTDSEYWINSQLANYFNVEKVVLKD